MKVIAVTGGIGCGKSTATAVFRALGARVADADAISRALTAPGGAALPAVRKAFGDGVFAPDGTLNRRALAAAVFGDEAKRARLNGILHPMILAQMRREIEEARAAGAEAVILDVPLLYEAGMENLADCVICVTVPERVQLARVMERDHMSESEARARIASQWPLSEKERRADCVLRTDAPLADTRARAEALYHHLLERSPR